MTNCYICIVSPAMAFWDFVRITGSSLADLLCLSPPSHTPTTYHYQRVQSQIEPSIHLHQCEKKKPFQEPSTSTLQQQVNKRKRRAIAVSGTGNGDSFLRTAAARTACAMLRFSSPNAYPRNLADAVTAVAGTGGELQRSAGKRWGKTGEGAGGIIGIEAEREVDDDGNVTSAAAQGLLRGRVVFDFNCGGMFRAWMEEKEDGVEVERFLVFED